MKAALDGTGADVTFFAYLKLFDAEQKRNHVLGAVPLHVNLETIQPALRVLNITKDRLTVLETEESFLLNQDCGWRPGTELSQENILKRVIGQGVSFRECYKLVTEYEQKHNMKFDYVFRGRPDASFMDPLPAYCFWGLPTEDVFLRDPWIDHLFGTTRKHSDRLFNMIDEVYYNCHNRNRPEGIAEDILAGMVRAMRLREKTFPHSTVVTRFVGPSTCGGLRLPMIDGAMCDKVTVFNPSNPASGTPRITPS